MPKAAVWTLTGADDGSSDDERSTPDDPTPWLLLYMSQTHVYLVDAQLTLLVRRRPTPRAPVGRRHA